MEAPPPPAPAPAPPLQPASTRRITTRRSMSEPVPTSVQIRALPDSHIAEYPDFPEPGVLFRDIMPLLREDRKSTRLNSSHVAISYAVFCLKKKKKDNVHHCDHTKTVTGNVGQQER